MERLRRVFNTLRPLTGDVLLGELRSAIAARARAESRLNHFRGQQGISDDPLRAWLDEFFVALTKEAADRPNVPHPLLIVAAVEDEHQREKATGALARLLIRCAETLAKEGGRT